MAFLQSLVSQFRTTLPFLKPIQIIVLSFGITGYLIYKIPITGTLDLLKIKYLKNKAFTLSHPYLTRSSRLISTPLTFAHTDEAKAKSSKFQYLCSVAHVFIISFVVIPVEFLHPDQQEAGH